MEEENSGDDGAFADLDKINRATVATHLEEIEDDEDVKDESTVLREWLKLNAQETDLKKRLRDAEAALDAAAYGKYRKLSEVDIKSLAVDDKWLAALDAAIHSELDRLSQQLAQRVKELAERYEISLPDLAGRAVALDATMKNHVRRMGFSWT